MSLTDDEWLTQPDAWRPLFWEEFAQVPTDVRVAVPLGTCEGWRSFKNEVHFYRTGDADTGWMGFVSRKLRAAQMPHALGLVSVPDKFAPTLYLVKQFAIMLPNQAAVDSIMPGLMDEWDKVTALYERIVNGDAS